MNPAVPVSGEWASSFDAQVAEPPVAAPPAPKAQPKLNCVLPFIETDMPQVIRLLEWCCELSGQLSYTLFLLPFKGINFAEVKASAEKAFTDVEVIQDSEGVLSDWKEDAKIRDAAGPNSMFRQAAWYFYFHQTLGPWLYLEPDCVPLTKDWLQQLEADYREGNKPISGVAMEAADNKRYLNGVAIYPPNLVQVAPDIVTRSMWQQHQDCEIAFDIAGSAQVLQKAHVTEKIQFAHRITGPVEIQSGAVLFHGDRTGLFFEWFRERKSIPRKEGDAKCDVPAEKQLAVEETCALSTDTRSNGAVKFDPSTSAVVETVDGPARLRINPAWENASHEIEFHGPCIKNIDAKGTTLGEKIRYHVSALVQLENRQLSRHTRILDALRKAKLVPGPRPKKSRNQT